MTAKLITFGNVSLIGIVLLGSGACAQSQSTQTKAPEQVQTFFLANVTDRNEANDIQNDLRNVLPQSHVYYVESQGAISVQGTADEVQLAQKVISELDRRRKVYRLTYSITEMDGGKPGETRHVEVTLPTNAKTIVKEGDREPLVTGSVDRDSGTPRSQVQYIDVGLNIEATLDGNGDALRLRTSVEESSLADEKSGLGAQDPVIHQTKLDGVAMLTPGKPAVLGSLDFPGARREVIEVVSELVR